jgi:DNA-3-methyladenine glycosylase I
MSHRDEERGVSEYDSRGFREKLMLDGFQAGLSSLAISRKREALQRHSRILAGESGAPSGSPI